MVLYPNAGNSPYVINLDGIPTIQLALQDVYVYVDSTLGPVTIHLPLTTSFPAQNIRIFVQDKAGYAGTNNIRITSIGGETINDASFVVINTTKGFARIHIGAPGIWTATLSGSGSGGSGGLLAFAPFQTASGQNSYSPVLGFIGGTIERVNLDGTLLSPPSAGEWNYNSATDTLTFISIKISSVMWVQGDYLQ